MTAMASERRRARNSSLASIAAVVSVVVGTWLWSAMLEVMPFRESTVEGGGAEGTARKVMAMHALVRFLRQLPSRPVGNSFDTNAMGESWSGSPMNRWVDHTGPSTSEQLEEKLMSMKIGGKTSKDPRRLAMQARRLARQQELEQRIQEYENTMLRWADRPAAIASPSQLEEELTKMEIGHIGGLEGRRGAMRLERLAREEMLQKQTERQGRVKG